MSGEPRRVGFFCTTYLPPEMRHVYRQINALKTLEPVVIAQKRANAEHFPQRNLHLVPRSPWRFLGRFRERSLDGVPWSLSRREVRDILRIIKARDVRLLHVFFGNVAVHLLPLFRESSVPIVVSFHGADVTGSVLTRGSRRALAEVFERSACVFARSRHLADRVAELGCDPGKIRLSRTLLPELPVFTRTPPGDGAWRLVQACRLIPKKGTLTTLRAFARIANAAPRARLVFAGDGPLENDLRREAAALGIADRVEFTGFLDQPSLIQLFEHAHIFVHPSETTADGDVEGVPNALLEAMATGLPAVATTHGGIPETLENGRGIFLAPECDVAAVAAAILRIIEHPGPDPKHYAALSQAAAASVREAFSAESRAADLEAAYRGLM